MDPFAAIGLASAIVQFVDYSTKLINGAREIHSSVVGMTEENKSLEYIKSEMKTLSSKLLPSTSAPKSDEEKALYEVASKCNILADNIFALLEKVKPKDAASKRQSIQSALRSKKHEKEMQDLRRRLNNYRSQLNIQLNYLTSSDTKARLEILMKYAEVDKAKLERMEKNTSELREGVTIQSMTPEAQKQIRELLNLSEDLHRTVLRHRLLKCLAFGDTHGRFEAVDPAHFQTFKWILGGEVKNTDAVPSRGLEYGDERRSPQCPGPGPWIVYHRLAPLSKT